jgi:TonB family protein
VTGPAIRAIALLALGVSSSTRAASPDYVVSRVPPTYPLSAAAKSIEGRVLARLAVDVEGDVTDVTIIESAPTGVFDDSVKKATLSWHFTPKCGRLFQKKFEWTESFCFKMTAGPEGYKPTVLEPVEAGRPEFDAVQTSDGIMIGDADPCAKH